MQTLTLENLHLRLNTLQRCFRGHFPEDGLPIRLQVWRYQWDILYNLTFDPDPDGQGKHATILFEEDDNCCTVARILLEQLGGINS